MVTIKEIQNAFNEYTYNNLDTFNITNTDVELIFDQAELDHLFMVVNEF